MTNRVLPILVAAAAWINPAESARGEPAWGGNCLSCHDTWLGEMVTLFGHEDMVDPSDISTNGPMKLYHVGPGQTEAILADVTGLAVGDTYAASLRRFRHPGAQFGEQLQYTGDCAWPEWGTNAHWYSEPVIRYRWGDDPSTFVFYLDVEPSCPFDNFELVFCVAGRFCDSNELFYSEERFFVQVGIPSVPGDMNDNGTVDLADFPPWADCVAGPGVPFPPIGCESWDFDKADVDGDSDVDLTDFAAFTSELGG